MADKYNAYLTGLRETFRETALRRERIVHAFVARVMNAYAKPA
jgi:hypothetical protein